jgi:hypothetical protein
MNFHFLPIAPGHFVVIDHYRGLRSGAHVYICESAAHAGREVAASLIEMERFEDMDALSYDTDYDSTELFKVDTFRS